MSDKQPNAPAPYQGPTRVFSGVQPTGNLHLGNYLGAIRKFVDLQHEMECIFCVVDMHAITVWQEPSELRAQTREIAAAYLAAGVDPERAIIFNQSRVSAHAELAWILNCVARVGWLNRMTQFKDKAGKNAEKMSSGLYNYPVLMAADILAYKATHVPVGDDQKQHLELTRDIAAKFNNDFKSPAFFPQPEPLIQGAKGAAGARIMSLRDGAAKMSKSDISDNSRINMTDDADMIAKKIKKAKSDADALPSEAAGLEDRPEAKNLVGLYAALSCLPINEVLHTYGGQGFGAFKPALADLAVNKLAPIASEMLRLQNDPQYLDQIMSDGGHKADAIAQPILADVKEIVGFLR